MMDNIIFKPMISLSIMIIFSIIMAIVVIINRKHIVNRLLILILLMIISQRPMLKNQDDVSYELNLDVIFVIDTTVSMNAVDINNDTRLNQVKKISSEIIEELAGSNFAVITYDNVALMKYPFTNDNAVINSVIEQLKIIDPWYASPSSLSVPSDYLGMLLDSAKSKYELHNERRHTVVFFMGDGELNNENADSIDLSKYDGFSEMIDGGAVIGFGTSEGAKIKITEAVNFYKLTDKENYLLDNSTNPPTVAISKANEQNLKEVAKKLDLDYFNEKSNQLEKKLKEIKKMAIVDESDNVKNNKDLYYYFATASLILMLYELFYYRRNA